MAGSRATKAARKGPESLPPHLMAGSRATKAARVGPESLPPHLMAGSRATKAARVQRIYGESADDEEQSADKMEIEVYAPCESADDEEQSADKMEIEVYAPCEDEGSTSVEDGVEAEDGVAAGSRSPTEDGIAKRWSKLMKRLEREMNTQKWG